MSPLSRLEAELQTAEDGVNTCREFLEIEPGDAATLEGLAMFEQQVSDITAKIQAERATHAASLAPPPPPPPPPPAAHASQAKSDWNKSSSYMKPSVEDPPPPPDEVQHYAFNVKDVVQAKYSGDKQWYQATIISKTGSSTDPVYTVVFKGYDDQETKRKHEIRPLENPKKRKADGTTAAAETQKPVPSRTSNIDGSVISAEPSIDTSLVQQKREPSKVSDGPTRMAPEKKKLKGGKALDRSKAKWNDFQKTGPKAKTAFAASKAKDSMFRTTDTPTTKGMIQCCRPVKKSMTNRTGGFTGSAKPPAKESARPNWKYEKDGDYSD
nr:hypothetical protein CFP56_13246 [Quercus suber]